MHALSPRHVGLREKDEPATMSASMRRARQMPSGYASWMNPEQMFEKASLRGRIKGGCELPCFDKAPSGRCGDG